MFMILAIQSYIFKPTKTLLELKKNATSSKLELKKMPHHLNKV